MRAPGTTNVGKVKTGASQTLTQTFGGNGITKASQIAIVFNANEPSGNSITLTGLQMSVFNGNTDIFDAHLAASVSFPTTFTGIGKEGFVFRLDTTQAAALQTVLDGSDARGGRGTSPRSLGIGERRDWRPRDLQCGDDHGSPRDAHGSPGTRHTFIRGHSSRRAIVSRMEAAKEDLLGTTRPTNYSIHPANSSSRDVSLPPGYFAPAPPTTQSAKRSKAKLADGLAGAVQ